YYAYDVANRRFLWKNMHASTAGMFSNRSPAMTATQLFFPAGTKPWQKGALIALDRATGREMWVYRSSGSIHTAPVVLSTPDGRQIVGVGAAAGKYGWIALFDAATGAKLASAPLCGVGDPDNYAVGVSGQLSFVGFWGATTDSWGTVGWFIVPKLDFAAVKLDPGVPEGQKAKYGQTYTATVDFGSFFDTWFTGLTEVGIDADVNGQPVVLADENGRELPKISANKKTFYVLSPVPAGEGKWTVKFNWKAAPAPGTDKAVLRAWINLGMGRISATWPESDGASPTDPKNNLVRVEVPVEGVVDLAVDVAFPKKKYVISWISDAVFPSAMVKVFRTDGGKDPVKFRLTMTGPAGPKVVEMTITDKPQIFSYGFTATKAGKYTPAAERAIKLDPETVVLLADLKKQRAKLVRLLSAYRMRGDRVRVKGGKVVGF
ncbi:MAG: hypothetical protein AB1776_00005, partial [Bacillota bacterium]